MRPSKSADPPEAGRGSVTLDPVVPGWPSQPHHYKAAPLLFAIAIALVFFVLILAALLGTTLSTTMFG